jgi:hypothetical protein
VPITVRHLKPVFTEEQELTDHVRDLNYGFYKRGKKQLLCLTFEYGKKDNIPHRYNNVTNAARQHWVQDFCRRIIWLFDLWRCTVKV